VELNVIEQGDNLSRWPALKEARAAALRLRLPPSTRRERDLGVSVDGSPVQPTPHDSYSVAHGGVRVVRTMPGACGRRWWFHMGRQMNVAESLRGARTLGDRRVGMERGVSAPAAGRQPGALARRVLRVPLLPKLVAADVVINLLAYWLLGSVGTEYVGELMIVALLVTLLLNAALVYWALLPLTALEATAARVSGGDLAARVPPSFLADRNIARIGRTLNALLDRVTADQVRVRQLAAQVIGAGDQERAHIARELHDSTAQSLGALDLLMTAALREGNEATMAERMRVMQEIVAETLVEVRTLSHRAHPRVLDDLGLVAALEWLARSSREQTGVETRVTADMRAEVPHAAASVLYRVAQEALRNAARHASPSAVHLRVTSDAHEARLEVSDDGVGFDPDVVMAARTGLGLFTMRERVALIEGRLEVESRVGDGARILATVPITPAPAATS
jgi:signal transduction histidine kinase